MKRSQRFTVCLQLVASAAFLALAAGLTRPIESERRGLQLNWDPARAEGLPPEIAITGAALGTFRGLAVNFLWLRTVRLHEEGRFHEAMQLSDWITTLQPRFSMVWEFHAWNMAYNLSSANQDPQQRWLWVNAGIRLLRDRGIPHNPHSLGLYRELSWLYLHKIGRYHDSANLFYKTRLALHWHELLGEPPRDTTAGYLAWLERRLALPEVATRIREDEAMDPRFLLELAREYGPLDWRHSSSHALYWVLLGRRRSAESVKAPEGFVSLEADRLIFHALRALTHEGRIVLEPETEYFSTLPDPRFVRSFEKALEEVAARTGSLGTPSYRESRRQFLEWALRVAYTYGDRAEAERLLVRLRDLYGQEAGLTERYAAALDAFFDASLAEGLEDPFEVKQVVAGLLVRAFETGATPGGLERPEELFQKARELYGRFAEEQVDVDTTMEQLGFRSFEAMVADAALQFFADSSRPTAGRSLAWSRLPAALRRSLWPRLAPALERAAQADGLDIGEAFPVPESP